MEANRGAATVTADSQEAMSAPPAATKLAPRCLMPIGSIPVIGMGTFGSDHVSHESVAEAVTGGAAAGYRHFDCASVYGNEKEIGVAFNQVIESGVERSELWITSKVWNDSHDPVAVWDSCERSLEHLQLDYLDLFLVHWPFPNFHPPGCSVEARSAASKPYIHANFMKTWETMESLAHAGLVKNIGVSNMTIPKLELLLRDASVKPACNEMELHPHFQQPELFKYVVQNGLVPIGYCPLGSPGRPERDRVPGDTVDMQDPVIVRIAEEHNIHPSAVCLKWAVQRGQVPIPMSANPRNFISNLDAVVGAPLTTWEMKEIARIDKNCRLVKGQVFLWEGARSWEDLWDLDGRIAQ
jgi:alcohol dehydrogenase (NADP+)